jgi:superoxide dismutase
MDYGTKKPDYVSAVLASINWNTIGERIKMSPIGHQK